MQANFHSKRLQQARHLSRMSLAELGDSTEISRQALSQFERGERTPLPETLTKLASALGLQVEFFLRPIGKLEGSARTLVHFRSLQRTREIIREQQRASAILDLCAALVDTLEQHIEYQAASVPALDSGVNPRKLSTEAVEEVASATRKRLGLGDGPISDLALLVENLSIPIIHAPLTSGMDGMSAWYADRPFIVVSSQCSYARSRMNIAHEFGHLVLHRELSEEDAELDDDTFRIVEPQAWRFAGAFLLPAKSFLSEVYSVNVDALLVLKKKWGVSVAAMIRRLFDLGVIDESQQKNLNIQLRIRQWHKKEPGDDMPRERARLLNRAASFLAESGELSLHDLAREAKLPREFIADALEVSQDELLPPPPQNVVQFKLKTSSSI